MKELKKELKDTDTVNAITFSVNILCLKLQFIWFVYLAIISGESLV